jgi:hypothetical protein
MVDDHIDCQEIQRHSLEEEHSLIFHILVNLFISQLDQIDLEGSSFDQDIFQNI